MIAVIRIAGKNKLKTDIEETLKRLRLKDKYNCLVLEEPSQQIMGMVRKAKDFVAYGEISKEQYEKLKNNRTKEKNPRSRQGEVFKLHPPRKGIDSKKHSGVGRGVLGNNKEKINNLIERML